MTRVFDTLDEFTSVVGEELGTSGWVTVTQEQIDRFAEATGDRHWIHVDPQRAAQGPFGTTIAHGYLTLSLLAAFAEEIYRVDGLATSVHYGADKVRFCAPVPVGSRLRGTAILTDTAEGRNGTRTTIRFEVEREGSDQPALVADVLLIMAATPP
ncbi:MaoC family dehydratase [Streptomyces coelicoflavus]|uniref:MaoC family dehydratase n=1 Tax=Streptomyces coelicoflavus TaxID=285562 RepID=UPI0036B73F70